MKKERGITLIALIITIIIMLILVAVTVSVAVDGNLFGKAEEAVDKTNAKVGKLQQDIDYYTGKLDEVHENNNKHNWKRTGDNLYCEHCNSSFIIGDYIDYRAESSTNKVKVSSEESGFGQAKENDCINEELLSSINLSETDEQIFTQEELRWRVMGIEDSDGDGINESLLIKAANPTSQILIVYGAKAYNNGPEIMNRVCKELYSSAKYGEARSINIYDVNNTFGYIAKSGTYSDGNGNWFECDSLEKSVKDAIPSELWNKVISNGTKTPDGVDTEERLGKYKLNDYSYRFEGTKINYGINNNTMEVSENEVSVIDAGRTCYGLASCSAKVGSTVFSNLGEMPVYMTWGCGYVFNGFVMSGQFCFSSDGTMLPFDFHLCPVVALKNEIPNKISN